jgi:competence protein ComEA
MDALQVGPRADLGNDTAPFAAPTPANAEDLGEGRSTALAESSSLASRVARRVRESAWTPVAARASAIFVGMLGLAAIGAWSTLAGAGVPLTIPERPRADASGAWVAAAPSGATTHASAPPVASGAPEPAPAEGASTTPGGGVTADGKVVLNLATAEDLRKLPRVGQKRAAAILELRKKLGKFRKPGDLLRVRGIGPKSLRLMLPKLVVDAPEIGK